MDIEELRAAILTDENTVPSTYLVGRARLEACSHLLPEEEAKEMMERLNCFNIRK